MHLCTLRKKIGGHFRVGSFCYAFVYPDTFAYGIYYAFAYLRKTIGGHFRLVNACYVFVYQDTFAYGILLHICVPIVKQ